MMKKLRSVLLVSLAVIVAIAMSGCAKVSGILTPLAADEESEAAVAFEKAGVSIQAAEAAGVAMFRYQFQEPIHGMRVWVEVYRNGALMTDPVEINENDLSQDEGIIAFYTDMANGDVQKFTLFASNGIGPDARANVQLGSIAEGEALSPASQTSIDSTQITELGEQNVLLVMHDGPNLDTEATNDLNETQQIIESSTYTLVLYCEFS